MNLTLDWNAMFNSLTVAGLVFVAKLLWNVSGAVKAIQATQAAHDVLDASRFEAVNQRIDDLRTNGIGAVVRH